MEKKINILNVVGTRPVGGIGSILRSINKNIDTNKFSISYIFAAEGNEGDFDLETKSLGAEIYILPSLKLKNLFKYLFKIFVFYRDNSQNFDVIHVHSANTGVLDLFLSKVFGVKVRILHSHSTKYSDASVKCIRNWILQLPVKYLANYYFACSKGAANFLFGLKNLEKVTIVNNAVDSSKFKFDLDNRNLLRKELKLESKFIVGHIGNFDEVKNHSFLLDVFNDLLKINQNSCLLLIGTGDLESSIRDYANKLGISDHIIFMGRRSDIDSILQVMDVFVFPSFFEGLPVSLIEAQTSGLECFVSDTITSEVCISDCLHFLSLEKGAKYWAEMISTLNKEYKRESKHLQTINAGFDIKAQVSKLERSYNRICNL